MTTVKEMLSAFSEEIRVRMAMILEDSSLCVNCMVDVLGLPQPTVSRHLAILRMTGVVKTRKDRLHCYYTLNKDNDIIKNIVHAYRDSLKGVRPFKGDLKKMEKLKETCTADCALNLSKKETA